MDMPAMIARKLTETLRHHGVEMHPEDIRGLADDALAVMRDPTERMVSDGAFQIFRGELITPEDMDAARRVWRGMIKAATDT